MNKEGFGKADASFFTEKLSQTLRFVLYNEANNALFMLPWGGFWEV